ncbi:hypothetical protein LTR17_015569 [Elasticomyces elasticus]|nr:hypothetical protein LTR17_015569 [Elasticomyces elasticus]
MDLQQHMNNLLAAALATQEAQRASYDNKATIQHDPATMAPMVKQENTHQAADEKCDVGHYDSGIHDSIMLPVCSGSDGKTTMRAVTRKELSDAIDGLLSHELATTSSRISSDRPHSTGATPEPEPEQTRKQVNTSTTTFVPARPAASRDERGPGNIIRHREDNTSATRGHASGSRRDEAPGDFYASQRQQHAASKLQQLGGSAPRKPVERTLPQSFVPPTSVRVPSVMPPQQKRPPIIDTEICGVCAQNHGSNDATCDFTRRKAQGHTHCSNCEHKKKNGKPKLQCNRAGKVANKPMVNDQRSSAVEASSTSHKADVIPLHKSDRRDSGYGGLPVANVLPGRRTYDSPYPQMPAQYGPDLASQMMGSMFGIQMPMPPMLDGAYGMQAPMHGMPGNPFGMHDGSYGMPSVSSGMPEFSYGPTNSYRQPIVHTKTLPYAAWLAGCGMQAASRADVQTHDPLRGPMHPDRQMVYDIVASKPPAGVASSASQAPRSSGTANAKDTTQQEIEKLKHKRSSLVGMTKSIAQRTPGELGGHMKTIGAIDRSIAKLQKRSSTFEISKPSHSMQRMILHARIRVQGDRHRQLLEELREAAQNPPEQLSKLRQTVEAAERELDRLKASADGVESMSGSNNNAVLGEFSLPVQNQPSHRDSRIVKLGEKLYSVLAEFDWAKRLTPERLPSLKEKVEALESELLMFEPGARTGGSGNRCTEGRIVIDLTEETKPGHAASSDGRARPALTDITAQQAPGSGGTLRSGDVSTSTQQLSSDPSATDTKTENKGVRKLEEQGKLLCAALHAAKEEDSEKVTLIQQEIKALEHIFCKMLQKLTSELGKVKTKQPHRLGAHLETIHATEHALEELRSQAIHGADEKRDSGPVGAEQARTKRKRTDYDDEEAEADRIGNKGIRRLEEKRRVLNNALNTAKKANPESVSSIQQEIIATEALHRKVWHDLLQKLDRKLQSLRGGLEKIQNEQPGRLESHLWMIRTTESALEELRSKPVLEPSQDYAKSHRGSAQVGGKRKRDEFGRQEHNNNLVQDGDMQVTVQKKPRIDGPLPDQTTNEDAVTSLTRDSLEDGFPSKIKVMVTNLPYELSEDQLLQMFAEYSPIMATLVPRPIPKFMIKKLEARNEPRMGRGYAFVTLASEQMQQKACLEMDGQERMGREIGVKVATERAVMADRTAATEGEISGKMLDGTNACQEETVAVSTVETKTLYIGNLPYATTELDLGNLFVGFGVEKVSLQTDESTLPPSIHGFVGVATSADAERAVVELNGNVVLNHKVSVQLFGLRAGTWS